MKKVPYQANISETLVGRIRMICDVVGITETSFVESALTEATVRFERRSADVADALNRDNATHPWLCVCGRRFRLAAHRGNHQKVCPDYKGYQPEPEPAPELEPEPEPFPLGVDPSLIEVEDEPPFEHTVVGGNPTVTIEEFDPNADVPEL